MLRKIFLAVLATYAAFSHGDIENIVEQTSDTNEKAFISFEGVRLNSLGTTTMPDSSEKIVSQINIQYKTEKNQSIRIIAEEKASIPLSNIELFEFIYPSEEKYTKYAINSAFTFKKLGQTGKFVDITQPAAKTYLVVSVSSKNKTASTVARTNLDGIIDIRFSELASLINSDQNEKISISIKAHNPALSNEIRFDYTPNK